MKKTKSIVKCAIIVSVMLILSSCANAAQSIPTTEAESQTVVTEPDKEEESAAPQPAEEQDEQGLMSIEEFQQAERALFEAEDLGGKKIYVVGHQSPDTDTVCSAIAYADFLKKLGYDCEARIASKINNETKYVLNQCNMEAPEIIENVDGENLILVDHNEAAQAIDGIEGANVLGIVDHHTLNPLEMSFPARIEIEYTGATATLIALDYMKYGVEMDEMMAKLIALAILSDTSDFTNTEVTSADKMVYEKLSAIGGIEDTEKTFSEMSAAKKSYDGMTDEEIYFSDYKEYETNGYIFAIPYVRAKGEEGIKDMLARMEKVMVKQYEGSGIDWIITQVSDRDLDVSYIAVYGTGAAELCNEAFKEAEYDGHYFIFKPSVSRKSVLAPEISEVLKSQ